MILQRTIRVALSLGISLLLLVSGSSLFATSAGAGTIDDEQVFLALINRTRADRGLPPLIAHGELTAGARAWAASMAANDQLAHSPNMAVGISVRWTVLGENVGVHGIHDPVQLFNAFVASPSHFQNLVDPRFQYVGVGVIHAENGKMWTTHRFMAADVPSPAPTAPPTTAAPPTTKPPVTEPPTTKPPTTTKPAPAPTSRPPTTTAPRPTQATQPPQAPPTTSTVASPAPTKPGTTPSTTAAADKASIAGSSGADPAEHGESIDPSAAGDQPVDPAELVHPDVSTIEEVLIDLVEAGI